MQTDETPNIVEERKPSEPEKMPELGRKSNAIDDAQLKKMLSDSKPGFYQKNKHHIVTLCLIVINLVIFGIEVINSGFRFSIPSSVLVNMGAMYVPAIQSVTDLWRFITPMFLHIDLMHIAFNMVALYSVGGALERVLGKGNFLLLYFIGGITGNVVSYIADVYITGTVTVSAGASTSVFGLFIAMALLAVLFKGNRKYFLQLSKGMIAIIAINVAYSFVPGVSLSGHLGGALGGLIAMFILPSKNLRVPNVVRVLVAIVWIAALVYLFIERGIIAF